MTHCMIRVARGATPPLTSRCRTIGQLSVSTSTVEDRLRAELMQWKRVLLSSRLTEFIAEPAAFPVVFPKDPWTPERLAGLGLSERQTATVIALREEPAITTAVYMRAAGVSEATALRDLRSLTQKGVLVALGAGRAAHYALVRTSTRVSTEYSRQSRHNPIINPSISSRAPLRHFREGRHRNASSGLRAAFSGCSFDAC